MQKRLKQTNPQALLRVRLNCLGGDEGSRTLGLCHATAALSQLSYVPKQKDILPSRGRVSTDNLDLSRGSVAHRTMRPLYTAAMTSSSTSGGRNEAATTPAATIACATAPASRPWTPHAANKHAAAPRRSRRRLPPPAAACHHQKRWTRSSPASARWNQACSTEVWQSTMSSMMPRPRARASLTSSSKSSIVP